MMIVFMFGIIKGDFVWIIYFVANAEVICDMTIILVIVRSIIAKQGMMIPVKQYFQTRGR